MSHNVHVFAGCFDSREEACLYTEEQWAPEPDESVSDEEYSAWEDNNPTWALRSDLDVDYLTGDFIETINGGQRVEYLAKMLLSDEDRETVRESIAESENILVLIFDAAFDGRRARMASTSKLRYVGAFRCNIFC